MNHGSDEPLLRRPLNPRGKQVFMTKTIRFLSRNRQVPSSSLSITRRKRSTVKKLNKLKIHKLLKKSRSMVTIESNQKTTSIPPTQEYLDLQNICHHLV